MGIGGGEYGGGGGGGGGFGGGMTQSDYLSTYAGLKIRLSDYGSGRTHGFNSFGEFGYWTKVWRGYTGAELEADGITLRGVTVMPDKNVWVSLAQSSGGVNTDAWGIGLNAFGFANGAKTEIIDYAVRLGSSQTGLRAELQTLGKAGTRYLNAAKGLSKGAGILSLAFTGVDAYQKGEWKKHHTADVLIGLGTAFMLSGPWGWAAAGAYFLIDMGVKSYSGKSITENLFDGP